MKTYQIIYYSSLIIWAIVPFFYRQNKHFYFFLFLAFSDISTYLTNHIFQITGISPWISMHYLALAAFEKDFFYKYKYPIFIGFIFSIFISYISSHMTQAYILFSIYCIFFLFFIRYFLKIYFDHNKLNLFYIAMIFCTTLSLFKLISAIKNIDSEINIFYATDITQIFIGVFLILLTTKIFPNSAMPK
jgi:hypothetical protein